MIFKSETKKKSNHNGFIFGGSHIEGTLRFEDTFQVSGRVTGKVISSGTLLVAEEGVVEGEVEVGQIDISGRVEGKVRARRKVQIAPGGKVFADIETPALIIEDGAIFEGRCSMTPGSASSRPATKAATTEDGDGVVTAFSKDR